LKIIFRNHLQNGGIRSNEAAYFVRKLGTYPKHLRRGNGYILLYFP